MPVGGGGQEPLTPPRALEFAKRDFGQQGVHITPLAFFQKMIKNHKGQVGLQAINILSS